MSTPPASGTAALGPVLERSLSQAVRTPLHSVLGFLELLGMSELDRDQRSLLDQLVGSAEDLLLGSDRLLWLVRLLGGGYRPRPARLHLAAFAAEVAAASAGSVSSVVAPDAPPHLDVDLAALHQLVTELVANGAAHGAAPVVLAVTPAGREAVRITVSDGGTGLPAAARSVLTGPVGAPEPANGIGLFLVRHLAALLGGTVQLLPTPIGAHVALMLPLVATAEVPPAALPPAATAPGAPPRPLRVLLVEDNATNRLLTQRQLARLGHSLVAVATGAAGVRAALEDDVDVVLMDRHLPDIDGCEATRRIHRELPSWRPHLPIIGVTADATADARDACAAAGMDEVLTKPVDLDSLGAALARAAAAITRGDVALPHSGPPATEEVPAVLRPVLTRVEGDVGAATELVVTYLGEMPGRRLRIQAAVRRGEERAVLAAAESLRTSSESIGAAAVSGACAALAAAAAAGDLATARTLLPSLLLQCERFAADLGPYAEPGRIATALDTAAR